MKPSPTLLTAALLALLSAPAAADQCPAMVERIDAAAAGARLGPAQVSEVRRLRDEGGTLHGQGRHRQAVERLAEAAEILGLR